MPSSQALANTLAGIVGAGNVLSDADLKATYETDWTRRYTGAARLVFNDRLNAVVAGFFLLAVIVILVDSLIEWRGNSDARHLSWAQARHSVRRIWSRAGSAPAENAVSCRHV